MEVEGKQYNESFSIVPGEQPVAVKTPWCTIGYLFVMTSDLNSIEAILIWELMC